MGILVGLLILSIMMFVHELGHYLTGRRLGFNIEEFSIFMGPVLFSWERNHIRYSLKLLPIGASVRFSGEYPEPGEQSSDPGDFYNRPKWARAIVIGTGPALNLLSGVLAFLIMFSAFGYTVPVIDAVREGTLAAEAGLEPGDRIIRASGQAVRTTLDYSGAEMTTPYDQPMTLTVRGTDGQQRELVLQPRFETNYRLGVTVRLTEAGQAVIETVDPASNLNQPVLQAGDQLLAVNGVPYEDATAFSEAIQDAAGQPISVSVMRDGQAADLEMTATRYEDAVPRGLYFESSQAFGPAIGQSFQWTWSIVKVTVRSIGMLFTGQMRAQDTLAGPVGVVSMISDVVSEEQPLSEKVFQLLWMFALISVSLGFMNLLPIPPLDGNHLILIGVEAIRGRRLSVRVQNAIGMVGIGLIIALALLGLAFDLLRLSGKG